MQAGDAIELRTPNAVAGIRGTVVIAEVTRRGAGASTRFTLLTGIIEVMRLDALRQAVGEAAILTPLQTITVDRALSPVRSITPAQGHAASTSFRLPVKPRAGAAAQWVANDQVSQAVAVVETERGRKVDTRADVKPDRGGRGDGDDKPARIKLPVTPPTS